MTSIYVLVVVGAFLTGLSKGGLGGALGAIVTPMLALVMPAPVAVGLTLPMLLTGDLFALLAHWRHWDTRILIGVLPGTIVGVIVGSLVIGSLSPVTLQHGLGAVAILYTIYKIWERRFRRAQLENQSPNTPNQPIRNAIFGSSTGFASTLANAGGPIFTIYLLGMRVLPGIFVGTSAAYYAILNSMKIPAYLSAGILNGDTLIMASFALPLIPFGVWSGVILDRYLDMKTFEILILVFLAFTGVILLLK